MNNVFLYFVTIAVWGSSWLGIKLQLGLVPPELSVAYRFILAAALLLGWCWLRGLTLRFSLRQHAFIALQGLPLFSINYIIFYFATGYMTSGLVALTFSTIVIINIFLGALLLGLPVRPRVTLGAALGIAGLALVFWPDLVAFDLSSDRLIGLGLSLVATMFASLGNIASARNQRAGIPVVQGNSFGMALATLLTAVFVLVRGVPIVFDPSPAYVGSLLFLAVFASVIGFGSYLTLIGRIGPDRAAYASVVFPVIALTLSTFFEDYRWTPLAFAGMVLILIGNIVVLTRIGRKHEG